MDERNDTNIRAVSGYIAKPAINRVVSNSYMYTYRGLISAYAVLLRWPVLLLTYSHSM